MYLSEKNRRFAIIVTYKYPDSFPYKSFVHRNKIIAWIKALWNTKFGWRFFHYECDEQELVDLTFEQFRSKILFYADNQRPLSWRRGQAVFNYINSKYGVARYVQFLDRVDCYHNDNEIDQFILLSYKRVCGGF